VAAVGKSEIIIYFYPTDVLPFTTVVDPVALSLCSAEECT
jgi:hypothetical protein